MPTSGNVKALIPVLTPFVPTDDQFNLLYPHAVDEFTADDPGCSSAGSDRAVAYLLAHYLAAGKGQVGIQSEKIDDYSYTLVGVAATSSRWYAMYQDQIGRCRDALSLSASSLAGTTHEDATGLAGLNLDQNPVVAIRRRRA